MLSITSDYKDSRGCPEPYLRKIAEAGFTHVHWCHQWDTDFLYSDHEIEEARLWLVKFGLQVLDIHASAGVEKDWCSLQEYRRQAGLDLVKNRLRMAAKLRSDVIIMHIPKAPRGPGARQAFEDAVRRSLDELEPAAGRMGVRIAIENMIWDSFEQMRRGS